MKRLVITGPNGFIARNLIKDHHEDYEIMGVLRRGSELREDLMGMVSEVFEYDGTVESLLPAFKNSYGVIHLAAYFTNSTALEDQMKLIWDNTIFTGHVFEALRSLGKEDALTPVVAAQTFTAYNGIHEEEPANFYSATKLAGQYLSYGTNATFLVVSDSFGKGDLRPKIHNLVEKGVIKEFRSPLNQIMNLTHVSDIGDAFIKAVELANNPRAVRLDSYDLLYPENRVELREVAELLKKDVGSSNDVPITEVFMGQRFLPEFSIKRPVREFLGEELVGGVSD